MNICIKRIAVYLIAKITIKIYSKDKYPKHCLPDPGIKTLNTKHIIATGSGKIGIAALIVELLTISAGSILLLLFAIFKTLNAWYLCCSGVIQEIIFQNLSGSFWVFRLRLC